ncbi:hypothetical protein [Pontiella agarivorans]|uniref:Uncharacterized protein n=1 Tax=Pontiella agarivorans TaxID=3038953 RepID=A0ABU5N261_9BACT|nr:hypothetical protein [Pontiella agarivorans]MDZ8120507.1 hypothetical protein [Pontiella agarivorans]
MAETHIFHARRHIEKRQQCDFIQPSDKGFLKLEFDREEVRAGISGVDHGMNQQN